MENFQVVEEINLNDEESFVIIHKTKRKTQEQRILEHLQSGAEISSAEAFIKYGVMDLPKRISQLRKAGHNIVSRTGHSINEYGKVSYYIYRLEDTKDVELKP